MSSATVFLLSVVGLWVTSVFVNFFTCLHYGTFFPFLCIPLQIIGWYLPATCYNYNKDDAASIHLNMGVQMNDVSFGRCREIGWVMSALCAGMCYLIPCLVWVYGREGLLDWMGVVLIFWATTCWWWGQIAFIRYSKE